MGQKNNLNNLQINEKLKDATEGIQESAKNIGENIKESRVENLDEQALLEHSNKNYYSAIKTYQKALVLSKDLNDNKLVFDHYLLLAALYEEVGNLNFAVQQYDSALYILRVCPVQNENSFDSLLHIKRQ